MKKIKTTKTIKATNGKFVEYALYKCVKCGTLKEANVSIRKYIKTELCIQCSRSNNGLLNTKHGLSTTRLNSILHGMKIRCYSENHKQYKDYGGKGVSICDEWKHDITNFYNWAMKNGYEDNLTIDRIDSSGNYEPLNCQWVTHLINNQKTHLRIKINEENIIKTERLKKTKVKDISRILGVSTSTIERHCRRLEC